MITTTLVMAEPESRLSAKTLGALHEVTLRRTISLPLLLFYGLGTILVGFLVACSGVVSAAAVTRGAVGYIQIFDRLMR